jgi:hypothetical protein
VTRILFLATLLLSTSAFAQESDPEMGLTIGRLEGDASPTPAAVERPQLVHRNRTLPVVVGGVSLGLGALSLVGSWSVYFARQSYRMRAWPSLTNSVVDNWSRQGAWSLWLGVGAAGLLVTSEYMLLPDSREVPMVAWLVGVAGVAVAAVGIGFVVGGEACPPQEVRPGANLRLACTAATSDALFGHLLGLSSVALINAPVTYLVRSLFRGAPESLSFGVGNVQLSGRF